MKLITQLLSVVGLVLTVTPAFFVLSGALDDATHQLLMLAGTLLWLGTAPFWIFNKKTQ